MSRRSADNQIRPQARGPARRILTLNDGNGWRRQTDTTTIDTSPVFLVLPLSLVGCFMIRPVDFARKQIFSSPSTSLGRTSQTGHDLDARARTLYCTLLVGRQLSHVTHRYDCQVTGRSSLQRQSGLPRIACRDSPCKIQTMRTAQTSQLQGNEAQWLPSVVNSFWRLFAHRKF